MKKKRSLSMLLAVMMVLSLPLFIPVPTIAADSTASAFYYQHDPRLNAKAMKDIVVDPTAIYGFSPSPNGSLAAYATFDWSDRSKVDGKDGRQARIAYHQSIQEMYGMLSQMREDGKSAEEIARAVSQKRNEIRLASYKNPEDLARVKARNLEQYGHEEGPLPEELYEQYGSWEQVIEKAFSVNAGMDACLGLYDEYYELYLTIGQIEDEKNTAATREHTVAAFTDAEGLPSLSPEDTEKALSGFTDANLISTWYLPELAAAVSADVLRGYPDHTLLPQNTIRRVEAFVLLSRCLKNTDETESAISFTDVPDWAQNDINRLSKAGIVKGYGNGVFGANDLLTVEQVSILVERIRAANRQQPGLSFDNSTGDTEMKEAA